MRNPDNPALIPGGWVALKDADAFDPIFDLTHQWSTRLAALMDGRAHLETDKPFWIGQVFHEPILGIGPTRTSLIFLKGVEKVGK